MIGQILTLLKGLAVAIGWVKQASDEHTGAELEKGNAATEVLSTVQRSADAVSDPGNLSRVQQQSFRD